MRTLPKVSGSAAAAGLVLILLGGWQGASLANVYPSGTVRYAGRATVLRANVNVLTSSTKVLLADTGEMDSNGSTKDATVVTFDNPAPLDVHSKTAAALAAGADHVSAATAAVEKLVVNVGAVHITADVIEADSFAECHLDSGTVSVHGASTLTNLRINGMPYGYSSKVNNKIVIPGVATVIFNEQFSPDVNSMVVNAVHVIVPGVAGVASADVVISHAESGILTCTA